MIPKINNANLTMVKTTKNQIKNTVAIATGALAVLSTRQAWPYCQGLGPASPSSAKTYESEKVIINGNEMFVRKDIDVPNIDIDSEIPTDLPDITSETEKLHGLTGIIDNATTHIHDGIAHLGEKAGNAWDNVKDFFESLGH